MGKKIQRDPQSVALAQTILEKYQPETKEDVQEVMKDIFGPIFEAMLQGEMNAHLGYSSNNHDYKETPINLPRDRESTFEPQAIPKRTRDVSGIEDKVLSMYAKGMSQRDIVSTIEDIYGFNISAETISEITDKVLEEVQEWQNRPLKKFYTFMFVDCMYMSIKKEYETKNYAVYTILGYDVNGCKDILGIWLNESENKHNWMQIFDELKNRGVEDVLFISMDGISGLEEGAKAIFKNVVVQRCIVHLIRNSIKYVPSKSYKSFTAQLKKVYGAPSLKAAEGEFVKFKQTWNEYPGAIDIWTRNWKHVEQLFNYGNAVRKVMYTTNAIESVNSSFRKVTKRGSFPNENALFKLLYLRITELYKKWKNRPVGNWAMVRNQLSINPEMQSRVALYENI